MAFGQAQPRMKEAMNVALTTPAFRRTLAPSLKTGFNMTYLERAITDGHAKLTGEGKQQAVPAPNGGARVPRAALVTSKFGGADQLRVAVNHTERYADPEEQVRAEFWAERPPRAAATPRRGRWTRRLRRAINPAHRLAWRLTMATRRRRHSLRRGRRSHANINTLFERFYNDAAPTVLEWTAAKARFEQGLLGNS
jgi:hypothetical protein